MLIVNVSTYLRNGKPKEFQKKTRSLGHQTRKDGSRGRRRWNASMGDNL